MVCQFQIRRLCFGPIFACLLSVLGGSCSDGEISSTQGPCQQEVARPRHGDLECDAFAVYRSNSEHQVLMLEAGFMELMFQVGWRLLFIIVLMVRSDGVTGSVKYEI